MRGAVKTKMSKKVDNSEHMHGGNSFDASVRYDFGPVFSKVRRGATISKFSTTLGLRGVCQISVFSQIQNSPHYPTW